jgi:hypothetical protein
MVSIDNIQNLKSRNYKVIYVLHGKYQQVLPSTLGPNQTTSQGVGKPSNGALSVGSSGPYLASRPPGKYFKYVARWFEQFGANMILPLLVQDVGYFLFY